VFILGGNYSQEPVMYKKNYMDVLWHHGRRYSWGATIGEIIFICSYTWRQISFEILSSTISPKK
jgi:hypothetical protein